MYLIDSTSQMILNSTMFNVFKEVSSVHQAFIYLYILKCIFSCDFKAVFSASLLQIFRNHNNIQICCLKKIISIIMIIVENC